MMLKLQMSSSMKMEKEQYLKMKVEWLSVAWVRLQRVTLLAAPYFLKQLNQTK